MTPRDRLIAHLSDGRWHLSRDIHKATDLTRDDLRALGVIADGTVLGCTRRGFKLTSLSTAAERNAMRASIRSRIEALSARLVAITEPN